MGPFMPKYPKALYKCNKLIFTCFIYKDHFTHTEWQVQAIAFFTAGRTLS